MKKIICLLSLFFAAGSAWCQSLSIFDIDTSAFPIMKAKIFALDADGKQVTGINTSDLSLTENGIPREIVSVSCPPTKPAQRISSTIVIDVSGSMSGAPLEIAKTVAKTWVNALPLGQSDCALVSFNGSNYFNQDFTTNRNKLLSAIDGLISDDGTDYNAAMINPVAGGILTAKAGKHRKVIVFITDGLPNNPPDEARIIAEANANGIMIHCITIGLPAHSSMVHFAEQTGGLLFENVSTEQEAKSIAQMISCRSVYGFKPCEIQWKSENVCAQQFINVRFSWNALSSSAKYFTSESAISDLLIIPNSVRFRNKSIGVKSDTILTITAINADFNISGIVASDPKFSITPSNLTIPKGETKEIILSFTPIDSSACYTYIDIQNNKCPMRYYAEGVYPNQRYNISNLKLTFPNGGEEFLVGTDTLITWEGVLPQDTVKLEYSYDSGATWNLITDSATGFKYVWKNVQKPESKSCLVRVTTKSDSVNIEWESIFGGSSDDYPFEIIQTENGYLVVGQTNSWDDDVDSSFGSSDIWVIHLNKLGKPIWKKTLGTSKYECGYSVTKTDDGEIVIGGVALRNEIPPSKGYDSFDYWIVKLDITGNVIWSKKYGGTEDDWLYSIEKTNDGGLIAVGVSTSSDGDVSVNHGEHDAWIVKLDSVGNLIWQKSFGGSSRDFAYSVTPTKDNGFVIAGETYSINGDILINKGGTDCWVIKINADGNLIWSKTFGGTSGDGLTSIIETQDQGIIVAGQSYSIDCDFKDIQDNGSSLIAKLDESGKIQWIKKSFGYGANSIIETWDGECLYVGEAYGDKYGEINSYIIKLSKTGNAIWTKIHDKYLVNGSHSVAQAQGGSYITTGKVWENGYRKWDYLIIKYSPDIPPQSDVSDSVFSIVSPTVTALNIDMGQVVLGSYKDSVITAFIKNTSKYDCLIKDISSASSDFYVISNPTFTLEGGKEQAIEIHFKPSKIGKIYSNINIVTQDTSFSQSIEGEGVQPTIQISANLIDFGKLNVKELKDTVVVMLKNISGGPIDINDVKLLGPDKKQFEILDGGGAFSLTAGQTRELKLRFKPVYIGRTSCMLGFFHNGINSPAKAQLYGQGVGGLITVSNDSAYAGEKVKINLVLSHIAPSSLQNVASSFKAKLKYLTAPLSLVKTALKIGETPDSTIIEVSGKIGADSVLYMIDYIANDTPKDFTTIDLEEIKWFDAGGNEVDYEAETQNGSFKLLKYSGMAKIYCTCDSARPGDQVTLKLKTFGIDPASFKETAPKFKATLRYHKTILAALDKILPIKYASDSAYIEINGAVGTSNELASIDFVTGLGAVDSTSIDITEFKWLNASGDEVPYETLTQSGFFKLLGTCREGGERLFNPTGKAEILRLAPNPARDEITVTVNRIEKGESFIVIYNSLGAEAGRIALAGAPLDEKEIKINLASYPRGAYFIRFQTPTVSTGRMVTFE